MESPTKLLKTLLLLSSLLSSCHMQSHTFSFKSMYHMLVKMDHKLDRIASHVQVPYKPTSILFNDPTIRVEPVPARLPGVPEQDDHDEETYYQRVLSRSTVQDESASIFHDFDTPTVQAGYKYYSNRDDYCECATNHPLLEVRRTSRIVGGEASPFRLPWQVYLEIFRKNRYGKKISRCGGTVINKKFVLSAMHCFYGRVSLKKPKRNIRVGAGIHDICSTRAIDRQGWQKRYVKRIHHTGAYHPKSFDNDIAILELTQNLLLNEYVQPACLPSLLYPPGTTLYVSGWGHNARKLTPCELHYLPMSKQPMEICRNSSLGIAYKDEIGRELPDIHMCAGYLGGGKDSCQGDSGGPLVAVGIDRKVELVGIVSWGIGCAKLNSPGAYVNVFQFLDFIKYTVAPGECELPQHQTNNRYPELSYPWMQYGY